MNKKWNRPTTNGKGKNTKLYLVWKSIKNRCLNIKNPDYKNYGDRGISLCSNWLIFDNFYDWAISNDYKEGLEIDRKDNNKGYYPENCRFVNRQVNQFNKRVVGKSKFRGVHPHRKFKSFIATISHKGKSIYIGTYKTEILAAKAFDVKCKELRGDLAVLNFN